MSRDESDIRGPGDTSETQPNCIFCLKAWIIDRCLGEIHIRCRHAHEGSSSRAMEVNCIVYHLATFSSNNYDLSSILLRFQKTTTKSTCPCKWLQ